MKKKLMLMAILDVFFLLVIVAVRYLYFDSNLLMFVAIPIWSVFVSVFSNVVTGNTSILDILIGAYINLLIMIVLLVIILDTGIMLSLLDGYLPSVGEWLWALAANIVVGVGLLVSSD